jgi:hypothetical protein
MSVILIDIDSRGGTGIRRSEYYNDHPPEINSYIDIESNTKTGGWNEVVEKQVMEQ